MIPKEQMTVSPIQVNYGGYHLPQDASDLICGAIHDKKTIRYGPVRQFEKGPITGFELSIDSSNPGTELVRRWNIEEMLKG
ncbi:hypothetical protein COX23_03170 [Candidatus Gottesmanbacteria bacterium CG23_combo_of_CG06-09_8_20_14_all_37_19]|uniref:Uncharacterized protein n=1 Tax=Candidatus Gottesmanbacteria bacterium CG1_02_37_22 TaxID=1805209 RepID=A0A1J4TX14_9BACT|nr:MAG: hypothetical protein AUJ73_01210 [Candidatus Gottesmanbacteria bacterium CG1_02_37_22]PIP32725.1 MAG: hypothetical protein COX23_03170 [Candidatus Gottesmanbacteria bacterium CG23_combo_of_CG06-09_8_20_14_all_37_19]